MAYRNNYRRGYQTRLPITAGAGRTAGTSV